MESPEVIEVGTAAIWVLIKISLPLMLVGLGVGLAISLFQALTQIQEMTLVFVPKMISMYLMIILLMPYMLTTLKDFTVELADRIVKIE